MSGYQSTAHRYKEVAVKTANPLQLVVMLYDAAICSLKEAKEQVGRKDIAGRARSINKCISIISELQSCLNIKQGGEIASSLDRLYDYMKRRIFTANVEQSIEPLKEIESLLGNLRSAWSELVAQNQTSSSQQGAQPLPEPEIIGSGNPVSMQIKSLNISI
jgi:flagellar secretion chaperone FliS